MPSASFPNAPAFEAAAPPPAPSVAILASPSPSQSVGIATSYVDSALEQYGQLLTVFQQDVSRDMQAIDRDIAQVVIYVGQLWDSRFGIQFNASNSVFTTPAPQPRSGSGTGQDTPHQPLNNSTQQTGRGLGSGSSTTTTHGNNPVVEMHPLTSDSGSGNGINPMPATVSGYVWLDNNGDGVINNGETALPGVTVNLYDVTTGMNQVGSGVSDANGNYNISLSYGGIPGNQYEVGVDFSTFDYATIMGSDSDIYPSTGFSPQFTLGPGTNENIPVGIRSMTVTTLNDDPNGIIPQQITLRDAIETGNNGPPPSDAVAFIDPETLQNLSGTISLQAALPAIQKSYNINGPGASTLAVSGANLFNVFTVQATSTISGLTIENGYAQSGGGVFNSGTLTLSNDSVVNNDPVNGGGIFNTKGKLKVISDDINNNTATQDGGGLYNAGGGQVTISGSEFYNNRATNGGGISNNGGGGGGATLTIANNTVIDYNIVTGTGGGLYNTSGKVRVTVQSISLLEAAACPSCS